MLQVTGLDCVDRINDRLSAERLQLLQNRKKHFENQRDKIKQQVTVCFYVCLFVCLSVCLSVCHTKIKSNQSFAISLFIRWLHITVTYTELASSSWALFDSVEMLLSLLAKAWCQGLLDRDSRLMAIFHDNSLLQCVFRSLIWMQAQHRWASSWHHWNTRRTSGSWRSLIHKSTFSPRRNCAYVLPSTTSNTRFQVYFLFTIIPFSALTLLVGWQEGHLTCKNWVLVCRWWWSDWSFAHLIVPVVTTYTSYFASINTG